MKKLISILLVICMLPITLIACTSEDKTHNQYECGKEAFNSISQAQDLCVQLGDAVYAAWYFAIYKLNDYSGGTSALTVYKDFANDAGLSFDELVTALEKLTGQDRTKMEPYYYDLYSYVSDFNKSVKIVLTAYQQKGIFEELNTNLVNAKSALQTMNEKYPDYSEYSMLKTYYAKVTSYSEFITSPTGSFQQLKTTIETYEREIRDCKGNLDLTFAQ